jgi:hypothetical protein
VSPLSQGREHAKESREFSTRPLLAAKSIACGKGDVMKLLYRRCAGIDIHKKSISVCIRRSIAGKKEAEVGEAVCGP